MLQVKASDLQYRYRKNIKTKASPEFRGKPDPVPFDRDDLHEVLPLLGKVMDELGHDDQRTLHLAEEIMVRWLPSFLVRRDEVFDFILNSVREELDL